MNLWFDECLPPKWCRCLSDMLQLCKPPIAATHLLQLFGQGLPDDKVVEHLRAQPGPVILISGDSGAQTKAGDPRMCALCPQAGITCVILSRKLCQANGFEKVRMLFWCFPQIELAAKAAPGTRFRLERAGADAYRVREWPIVPAPSTGA